MLPKNFALPPPSHENIADFLGVLDSWVNGALHAVGALERVSLELLVERFGPVWDLCKQYGITFDLECHPSERAMGDLESASDYINHMCKAGYEGVSKTISGVVALRLAERGVLDLDRPMSSFRGWTEFCADVMKEGPRVFFADYRCDTEPLTLRHVLSMSANGAVGERFLYNPISFSWASRPIAEAAGRRRAVAGPQRAGPGVDGTESER